MEKTCTARFNVRHAPAFLAKFGDRCELDIRPYHDERLITFWIDYDNDIDEFMDFCDDRNMNYSIMIMRHHSAKPVSE